MEQITIELTEAQMRTLKALASEFGITPEEAAKLGIEDLITRAETSFSETIEYVIEKNRELYHRLAK